MATGVTVATRPLMAALIPSIDASLVVSLLYSFCKSENEIDQHSISDTTTVLWSVDQSEYRKL